MKTSAEWDERYRTGNLPWDTGRDDKNLSHCIEDSCVAPCRMLDLGCGTGSNAVWLAKQGFSVTGIDIAPLAIEAARQRAASEGVDISFSAADILTDPIPNAPFEFVFDRGCFHSMDNPPDTERCTELISGYLTTGGLWLSLIGNADGPVREVGPPRRSASEIVSAVEPRFEIISLRRTDFDSDDEDPPLAWACLMRRRSQQI